MNKRLKQVLKNIRLTGLSLTHKKNIIQMSHKEAEKIIMKEYTPKPLYTREIKLQPLDINNYHLSIIIPAYNCAGYIEKCLTTLINQQTKYTYEIIVVNDGSKDNTEETIKSIKSPLIRIINQENGGAAMARNTGLMNATGEYVCFVDGDDYVEPDYIDRLLTEAYKHDADIVKCGYYMYNAETPDDIGEKIIRKGAVITGDMTKYISQYDGFIWNMVERRSIWKDFAFPEKWWFEDMITKFLPMRKCSKFVYIEEALYHYAIMETSLSRSEWKSSDVRSIDQLWLVKEIIDHNNDFKLENNLELYNIILHELGEMLCGRTYGLNQAMRYAVFITAVYATEVFRKKKFDNHLQKLKYKKVNQAFAERDFNLWELASLRG